MSEIIPIGEKVLSENDRLAAEIRAWLERLTGHNPSAASAAGGALRE